MRIVYNNGEKELIKEKQKLIRGQGMGIFNMDNPDAVYGLTFKVTDPEIAEYILLSLLYDKLEDFDIGIDVKSVDFVDIETRKENRKTRICAAIEDILR